MSKVVPLAIVLVEKYTNGGVIMSKTGEVPREDLPHQKASLTPGVAGKLPVPFVLRRMETRIGAIDPTTSGTYDCMDAADYS